MKSNVTFRAHRALVLAGFVLLAAATFASSAQAHAYKSPEVVGICDLPFSPPCLLLCKTRSEDYGPLPVALGGGYLGIGTGPEAPPGSPDKYGPYNYSYVC